MGPCIPVGRAPDEMRYRCSSPLPIAFRRRLGRHTDRVGPRNSRNRASTSLPALPLLERRSGTPSYQPTRRGDTPSGSQVARGSPPSPDRRRGRRAHGECSAASRRRPLHVRAGPPTASKVSSDQASASIHSLGRSRPDLDEVRTFDCSICRKQLEQATDYSTGLLLHGAESEASRADLRDRPPSRSSRSVSCLWSSFLKRRK